MARILVVDDAPVDRTVAGGLLSSVPDWHVTYASDGQEALELVANQPLDLILTDLHMPKLDGLKLVAEVKANHPGIPVVLMTHHGGEELALQAIERGAASYVPKRSMGRLLRTTVQRILTLAKEERTYHEVMRNVIRREDFELENNPDYIDFLAGYFRKSLQEIWHCEASNCVRVGVALAEALSNAVYHGNLELTSELRVTDAQQFYELAMERCQQPPYRERRLRVSAQISPDLATFVILDDGPGFDPGALGDPTDAAWLEMPCGRGVLLMRSFMDEVTYHGRGNEVRLSKRRVTVCC